MPCCNESGFWMDMSQTMFWGSFRFYQSPWLWVLRTHAISGFFVTLIALFFHICWLVHFFRLLPQWGLRFTAAYGIFFELFKPMIAHNHAVQTNWMGDRVTLLPLCVVSCSQRSVLETNHLPLRHIQVTAFAVSSFLIHRIIFLQANCDFACCIACLWSRLLGCKFCWRQLGWQTQCDDNALW